MEPKNNSEPLFNNIRYTINKKDIAEFVNSLHTFQEQIMDSVLEQKAREGFPEANEVINYIRSLK
jgi:hypothetical protein